MNAQPQGIPLRPDRDALRRANVTEFYRHCFHAANRAINPHETRAAVGPATTTGSGWADKLAPTVVGDFIASLQPLSAGARLLAAAPRVDLTAWLPSCFHAGRGPSRPPPLPGSPKATRRRCCNSCSTA